MSHFPYLEKQFIQNILNPYSLSQQNDWKKHLNSQILQKYIQIKQKQKQKVAEILPYYYIFPKNHSDHNFYTEKYDLDRLQRLKNAQNMKYKEKQSKYSENSRIRHETQFKLPKSQSQINLSKNAVHQNKKHFLSPNSAKKQYENKSTKSLTQTNVSPSKRSKYYFNKNLSKLTGNQSDSQVSLQNFNRQNVAKQKDGRTQIQRIRKRIQEHKRKDSEVIFKNVESTLTLPKQKKQDLFNEYYNKEKSSIQFRQNQKERRTNDMSKMRNVHKGNKVNKLDEQANSEYGNQYRRGNIQFNESRKYSQFYEQGNPRQSTTNIQRLSFKQSQINKQGKVKLVSQKRNDHLSTRTVSKNNPNFESITKLQTVQKNQNNQRISFNLEQNQKNNNQVNQLQEKIQQNQLLSNRSNNYKIQQSPALKNGLKNNHQNKNVYHGSQKTKKHTDEINQYNYAKSNQITKNAQIEQKLVQYYGEQFQRIKQQRDFLRKHFILHLQNKHTSQLPYNQLTSISPDYSNKKLIIQKQNIPTKLAKNQQKYKVEVDLKQ